MAFKQGEVYKCPDPQCGCEITVTKGAPPKLRWKSTTAMLLRKRYGENAMKHLGTVFFLLLVVLNSAPTALFAQM